MKCPLPIVSVSKVMRTIEKADGGSEPLPPQVRTSNRACLVVFSGEMDKRMAAFIIATGAVAMGLQASIFFTS
jgi:hypothetical protein